MSAIRGRIIWAEVQDPQGRNPKLRPLVILTATEEILADGVVQCVAVSSQLDQTPAESQVAMPWHAQGHPRTGLREPCAAVCNWLVQIPVSRIESFGGTTPAKQLLAILQKVAELQDG